MRKPALGFSHTSYGITPSNVCCDFKFRSNYEFQIKMRQSPHFDLEVPLVRFFHSLVATHVATRHPERLLVYRSIECYIRSLSFSRRVHDLATRVRGKSSMRHKPEAPAKDLRSRFRLV